MCGRYTLRTRLNKLLQIYAANPEFDCEPRYNIAPTQQVVAVRTKPSSPDREMVLLKWGLVPAWADDLRIGNRMINARAETLAEKNSFKTALKRRRCLVLADGFYEWIKEGKIKQPYFIHMKDDRPFAFAGLWDRWSKSEPPVESCTIITTTANSLMAPLHDRMPVILTEDAVSLWLDPKFEDPLALASLLAQYPDEEMEAYPVSTVVNSARHEAADCVQKIQ
jgi:putative SOS response-associated peptidase YedK